MKAGEDLRAAIIGLGVGQGHISGYETASQCKVVALCDSDATRLREVGARYPHCRLTSDPMEILADRSIDVVSIASYDNVHAEQVIIAIENGKHVFIEKPLCLHQKELDHIIETLLISSEIKVSANYILRRVPRFIELRSKIQSGDLGKVYYVEGDYDYGRINKITMGWRASIPYYSVVHGGAIHLIDLMLWLTGERVNEVFAYGSKICTEGTAFKYHDFVVAILQFENGMIGKVTANFGSVTPHHHKLCVYGTNAVFNQGHTGAFYSFTRDPDLDFESVDDLYPGASKGDMLPSFVKCILNGTEPDVTAQEVFDAMSVSLAVEASVVSGQPEKVQYRDVCTK